MELKVIKKLALNCILLGLVSLIAGPKVNTDLLDIRIKSLL